MTVREERGTAARRRWPLVVGGVAAVLAVVLALAVAWPPRLDLPLPVPDAPASTGLRLDAGAGLTCAVGPDDTLACWGGNSNGELGIGARSPGRASPVRVANLGADVASVSVEGSQACAVTRAGAAWCWGRGFLGDGTTESALPVAVAGLGSSVRSLTTGSWHTCAVTTSGGVLCWGDNGSSALGQAAPVRDDDGDVVSGVASSGVPVPVPGLESGVGSISAGWAHTCALTTTGGVLCWGNNGSGQLGQPVPTYDENGTAVSGVVSSGVPVPVPGLESGVVSVSAGGSHTCVLTTRRAVLCWGDNGSGQLGQPAPTYDEDGTPVSGVALNTVPTLVPGLDAGVDSLSAGWSQSCVVTTRGGVQCWGENGSGQLGQSVPTYDDTGTLVSGIASNATPAPVPALESGVATVDVGAGHTCAVTTSGGLLCWGDNGNGQLGDAAAAGGPEPVGVRYLPSVRPTPREPLLNIIVVETTVDVGGADESTETRQSTAATAARLYARDPAMLESIRTGVREATSGRLDPRVEVVVAKGLLTKFKGCVPTYGADDIERVAEPVRRDGAMNVIILRAKLCTDADWGALGGFDSWYGSPVVGWTSLSSVTGLVHVLVHEYGHDVSLWHAGTSTCTDAAALTGCQTDEVGDRASVMSYVHSSDVFSAPELARLGLLADTEIVDVAAPSGEYHLVNLWQDGTKVVRLRNVTTDSGSTTVDFSRGALRVEVRFDKLGGASVYGPERSQPSLSVVETERPPAPGDVLLRQKDVTVTYEGPDADGNSVIKVTRTP